MKNRSILVGGILLLSAISLNTDSFAKSAQKSGGLNLVEVLHPGKNALSPTHITFDFSAPVTVDVNDEDITQSGKISVSFSNVMISEQQKKEIKRKLSAIALVKDVAISGGSQNKNAFSLTLAFNKEEHSAHATGATIRVGQTQDSHRSNRVFLVIYPNRLLHEWVKNQRGLQLASASPPKRDYLRIVIDAGHGGPDAGAKGLFSLLEKDVTLDIARRIKPCIEKWGGKVVLTRTTDKNVAIEDRTLLAHQLKADLFISIHANSAGSIRRAQGVETYHFDKDMHAKGSVYCTHKSINREKVELLDSMIMNNVALSSQLSYSIQRAILAELTSKGHSVNDRGVKKEGYRLLLHSQLPSHESTAHFIPTSLVEVGFITNPKEAGLLRTQGYRELLARGISKGIETFIKETRKRV